MPIKEYKFPQEMQELGNTYYDEYATMDGLSLTTPEYDISISKIDPIIGHRIVDIHWNASRDGEMLIIEMSNGKQLEIYKNADNKISIDSD